MGKGQRLSEAVEEYQWDDISKTEEKGQYTLNTFVPLPEIQLDGLDFDKISDVELIASFGEKNVDEHGRTVYPFTYLCHGTFKNHVEAIEREGLRGAKGSSSREFEDCCFTWFHLYPHDFIYDSPDDERLKASNKSKRDHLLKNVMGEDNRTTLEEHLIRSAMFRVKLFPFIEYNFIASITDIIEEYKTIMKCEEIELKKYGTFVYLDPYKRTKYLREVMYGIIVCPKGTEKFSSLDNLSNDNDIFEYNAENPLEGAWKWIPYSTSLVGKEQRKRLWDYIGFAFYMNDDQMRLKPPGTWKALEVPKL
ncbi:uncharacterized protein LOC118767389 [Octopus sinensis]|uniref:Uncharacterized protein LOC118767389 n=1 Tax=Octopus sinensis TaxID=2607531 RepID=A0A7E6FJA4_9MOLL|nr:uncharacterized protein LOC118767389 [Octopus sinensis]